MGRLRNGETVRGSWARRGCGSGDMSGYLFGNRHGGLAFFVHFWSFRDGRSSVVCGSVGDDEAFCGDGPF